jgi:hypothetical protein
LISALDLFGDRVFSCSLSYNEIDLVVGRILSLREGEFLLEKEICLRVCMKRSEDRGDILQVDQLAFLDICKGCTSDLSEGRIGEVEGRMHCAEAVFF